MITLNLPDGEKTFFLEYGCEKPVMGGPNLAKLIIIMKNNFHVIKAY